MASRDEGMSKLNLKVGQSAGFSDLLNWRSYSCLQKLLIVMIAVIAISWLSSLWTLIIVLTLSIGFGINISKKVSQPDVGEQYAQGVQTKLQECAMHLNTAYKNVKFIAFGHGTLNVGETSESDRSAQNDEDADSSSGAEKGVFSDDWSISRSLPVKVPCDIYLEINSLQLLIVRDFIQSWYSEFSYDPDFLKESKVLLQQACNNIVYSLSCQSPETIAITIIKHFQVHVGMYWKAKSSYVSHQIHPKTKISDAPSIRTFQRLTSVEEAFEKEFSFHYALSSPETEFAYLRGIVSIFLLSIIPNDVVEGKCAKSLLVEILTANVMLPLMELISDPDWLMEKIILLTSDEKLLEPETSEDQKDGNTINQTVSESTEMGSDSDRQNPKKEELVSNAPKTAMQNDTSLSGSLSFAKSEGAILEEEDHLALDEAKSSQSESKPSFTDSIPLPLDDSLSINSDDVFVESVITKPCDKSSPLSSSVVVNNGNEHQCEGEKENGNINLSSNESADSTAAVVGLPPPSSSESKQQHSEMRVESETNATSCTVRTPSPFVVLEENVLDPTTNQTSTQSSNCCSVNGDKAEDSPSVSVNDSDMEQKIGEDELLSSDEIFSSDSYENVELDPQKIISYIPSQNSHDPQSLPDPMGTSFPKLSSIKNFFVDSFNKGSKATSQISKPKTLALFSDKITSNLNPLSSKLLVKNKGKQPVTDQIHQITPQLLVDDKPVTDSPNDVSESLESSQGLDESELQSPISALSTETSPGFFSNFPPFFSKSTSQTDLYISAALEESPLPTPSPSGQPDNVSSVDGGSGVQGPTSSSSTSAGCMVPKNPADIMSKSYVADDRRIFQDVAIPTTLTQKEYGSNAKYSLYVIEYEALYFTEEGKSVMKSGTVKRRYREFNNLQSRLEGYPTYKKYLKNIKGPKRWPTLPFKTLDKDTVKNRRIFMEKYLQDLIQIEAICNGPDLREFLAYEGDSHIAFVKKSPDVNVLRIDKMLMRGMSEVVDRLKSLPNIPQEVMSGFRGRDTAQEKAGQALPVEKDADTIEVEFDFDGHGNDATGSVFSDTCHNAVVSSTKALGTGEKGDLINVSQVIKDLKSSDTVRETYQQEIEKVLDLISKGHTVQRSQSSCSQQSSSGGPSDDNLGGNVHDLSDAVLDLVVQGLQGRDHWLCKQNVMTAVRIVLGKALNSYLEEIISDLTSNAQLVTYLRLARHTLWPQGQLLTESRPARTQAQKEATRQQARRCLIHFFPASLRMVLGPGEFDTMIDVFLGTLHNQRLNRHLIYQLLDTLIQHLFPDVVTDKDTLHKLLFSRTPAEGYS